MSKEITDEMVRNFINEEFCPKNIPFVLERWEKHKAGSPSGRDFEILEIKIPLLGKANVAFSRDNAGIFQTGLNGQVYVYPEFRLLAEGGTIHSVKRLSDGEVFTVGDKLNHGSYSQNVANDKIEKITIEGGDLYFDGDFGTEYHWTVNIKTAKKASPTPREPLFQCDDGKPAYEGDEVWQVSILEGSWKPRSTKVRKEIADVPSYFKYFSTEESAKTYCLTNRPFMSVQDVMNRLNGYFRKEATIAAFENLKAFAQQKINPL